MIGESGSILTYSCLILLPSIIVVLKISACIPTEGSWLKREEDRPYSQGIVFVLTVWVSHKGLTKEFPFVSLVLEFPWGRGAMPEGGPSKL